MINIKEKISEHAFEKKAHVYPSLDDFVIGQTYAFTVNPREQNSSFTECYFAHQSIFDLIAKQCLFDLRPEISTDTTRLHYHGRITFLKSINLVAFYYHTIPKLKDLCTFTIKPIINWEWYIYCIKTRHLMKPYMQHIGLIYRITNKTLSKIGDIKKSKQLKHNSHGLDYGI